MEEALFQNYTRLLDATDSTHYRYLYNEIDWDNRLIGITGSVSYTHLTLPTTPYV